MEFVKKFINAILKLMIITVIVGGVLNLHDLDTSYLWALILIYIGYNLIED